MLLDSIARIRRAPAVAAWGVANASSGAASARWLTATWPGWRSPILLAEPKLTKAMAFLGQPARSQGRTNNHLERMNRRLPFAEKVRYRWRKRKWVVRWVVLLLDVCWQQASEAPADEKGAKPLGKHSPPQPSASGKKKVAQGVGISEKVSEAKPVAAVRAIPVDKVRVVPEGRLVPIEVGLDQRQRQGAYRRGEARPRLGSPRVRGLLDGRPHADRVGRRRLAWPQRAGREPDRQATRRDKHHTEPRTLSIRHPFAPPTPLKKALRDREKYLRD
jgi:hypothetical protein